MQLVEWNPKIPSINDLIPSDIIGVKLRYLDSDEEVCSKKLLLIRSSSVQFSLRSLDSLLNLSCLSQGKGFDFYKNDYRCFPDFAGFRNFLKNHGEKCLTVFKFENTTEALNWIMEKESD